MASKFAPMLSQLRKERGISQKQAAADLGISQALLSHYEKGIRECGLDFVILCSNYYTVTTDYLLGVSESRNGISDEYFQQLSSNDGKITLKVLNEATKLLLDNTSASADKNYVSSVYEYYMLSLYRTAVTAGKCGMLPVDMFHLDLTLGRELANAALAVKDAEFALRDDRSRTGHDWTTKNTSLYSLIKYAEDYITTSFAVD